MCQDLGIKIQREAQQLKKAPRTKVLTQCHITLHGNTIQAVMQTLEKVNRQQIAMTTWMHKRRF